jgi:phosphoenolpyruvate---glycerone phosphotransferase subunit DhaL
MVMQEALNLAATQEMLAAVARHIVANVDMLTEVDQAIGDGDHGIGMRRGFTAVLEEMQKPATGGVDAPFKSAGIAIMSKTGGAAGAVFGTLFRSGGTALAGRGSFDGEALATFLHCGLAAVEKRGGSHPGQKTMLDALAPAAEAAAKAASGGLSAAVRAAAKAAAEGVEATKSMVATTGKARTLGERSLGHPDPGAVSLKLILEAMRGYIVSA